MSQVEQRQFDGYWEPLLAAEPGKPSRPAAFGLSSFVCPHCGAHAQQEWEEVLSRQFEPGTTPSRRSFNEKQALLAEVRTTERANLTELFAKEEASYPTFLDVSESQWTKRVYINTFLSRCLACARSSIWVGCKLIFPRSVVTYRPNEDLPLSAQADFEEAAKIVASSPRGAAALLRLSVEKLCRSLGKTGTIDQMIQSLVDDGLPKRVQKALDVVRVVGNEAVHPGTMDLNDSPETAHALFSLVNILAESMISEPRRIDEMFEALPQAKRDGIQQRDERAKARLKGAD